MKSYVINCATCQASAADCGDCLMSFIAEPDFGAPVRFSQEEADALQVMAEVGLVPTLHLVAANG
ncbi:MAG: hypothetical protein LBN10_08365 [Propionibacteriaceae bacterium]|nr:hypothetical protein [Propionibacteriaceae bacterium]